MGVNMNKYLDLLAVIREALHEAEISYREMGERIGCDKMTVYKALTQYGQRENLRIVSLIIAELDIQAIKDSYWGIFKEGV